LVALGSVLHPTFACPSSIVAFNAQLLCRARL
jgi:hypothetical protein